MSALAASHAPRATSHPRSELNAIQEISRLASAARRHDQALEAISSILLDIPGVWRVNIESPPELAEALNLDLTRRSPSGQWGSAIAPVEAGLYRWGQLQICFELSSDIARSPLRFAKYVAQQIAGLLDRIALRDQRDLLGRQKSALTRRLETRKAVARAMGLIVQRDHISPQTALAQITSTARRHRRSLLLAAQSVIFLEAEGGSLQSPTFRRLLPSEATSSYFQETNRRVAHP